MPQMNFDDHLHEVHDSPWHKENFEKFNDLSSKGRISTFGEDFGLDLLLSLAAINLLNASKEAVPSKKDDFVKTAMSVILPVVSILVALQYSSSLNRKALAVSDNLL
jgi:hypothetical protein